MFTVSKIKHFIRSKSIIWQIVFIILGLLLVSGTAVAAPTSFTIWDFDSDNTIPSTDLTGNAFASSGSTLSSENFYNGNPSTGSAWSFTDWSIGGLDSTKYFEFSVDLSNYGGITIDFDERRSGTGIRDFVVHYSIDGTNFTPIAATQTNVPDNVNWRTHSFDLGTETPIDLSIRGKSQVDFRIYGYNAEGSTGTWRIDNVTFTAATDPTAVSLQSFTGQSSSTPILLITTLLVLLLSSSALIWQRKRR